MATSKEIIKSFIEHQFADWRVIQSEEMPSNTADLIELPSTEKIVVAYTNTNITGTDRPKPQIRVFLDDVRGPFNFAKEKNYRFFLFTIFSQDLKHAKGITSFDPHNYIVSIETNLDNESSRRDLRSLYDYVQTIGAGDFIRCSKEKHNAGICQASFIDVGSSTSPKTEILEQYIRYFDNRPYMQSVDKGAYINVEDEEKEVGPTQIILFGAPGTGKSHLLNERANVFKQDNKIRFKPDVRKEKFIAKIKEEKKLTQETKDKYIQYLDEQSEFSKQLFSYNEIDDVKKVFDEKRMDNHKGDDYWILKRYLDFASREPLFIQHVERVTFQPSYTYSQFVGTYKPVQDLKDEKQIKYEYVPGPFLRVYKRAVKFPNQKFLLIIEEINRANVAAVFGDVFQLLDRKKGVSEYPIAASEDVQKYLVQNGINETQLAIPSNMYIWATMNSADQGVFPMDTAFKRRWKFEYIGIDDNESEVATYEIPLQKKDDGNHEWIAWNQIRHSINDKLTDMKINEDKLLGPYFISEEDLMTVRDRNEENADDFVDSFKSKVLMYLFEDAAKMKPRELFKEKIEVNGKTVDVKMRFSCICDAFDKVGQGIFNF